MQRHSAKRKRHGTPAKEVRQLVLHHPNAAGIDVGSNEHWVAVPPDRDPEPVRRFASFTESLVQLADWLAQCGVDTVAMESTGVYWIPLYELLEERGFEVFLVNAHQLKRAPGRKSDVLDCQWIQQLHSYGLLSASFRPTAEIVELRTYLRHRSMLVQGASRHIQHMQKAMTLMNVQLHNVVSDITGETGMRIIQGILSGNYDPEALAEHRHYRCKATKEEIAASLRGNYRREHLFLLRQALELYEFHQRQIRDCDQQIEQLMNTLSMKLTPPQAPSPASSARRKRRPKELTVDVHDSLCGITGVDLTGIPGIGEQSAVALISEIGTDMSRWPTAKNFTSWLRLAPGSNITGGKRISGRTPPGKTRAADVLRLAATAAARTQTAIGAFYRRLAARMDKPKAVVATARKLAEIIFAMLKHKIPFRDIGANEYDTRQRHRRLRSLKNAAKALGYQLVPEQRPLTPDDGSSVASAAVS